MKKIDLIGARFLEYAFVVLGSMIMLFMIVNILNGFFTIFEGLILVFVWLLCYFISFLIEDYMGL